MSRARGHARTHAHTHARTHARMCSRTSTTHFLGNNIILSSSSVCTLPVLLSYVRAYVRTYVRVNEYTLRGKKQARPHHMLVAPAAPCRDPLPPDSADGIAQRALYAEKLDSCSARASSAMHTGEWHSDSWLPAAPPPPSRVVRSVFAEAAAAAAAARFVLLFWFCFGRPCGWCMCVCVCVWWVRRCQRTHARTYARTPARTHARLRSSERLASSRQIQRHAHAQTMFPKALLLHSPPLPHTLQHARGNNQPHSPATMYGRVADTFWIQFRYLVAVIHAPGGGS